MILKTKGKAIHTKCYHCGNKTLFNIIGSCEHTIYPSDEDFSKIDQYKGIEMENLPEDEDSRQEIIWDYITSLNTREEYVRSIYYHEKQTLLVQCVSCSKPSLINIGKNITYDELQRTPLDTNPSNKLQYYDIASLTFDGYFIDVLYPMLQTTPRPSNGMPEKVAQVFEEARAVYNSSPRASAALLRLALEILLKEDLGLKGNDLCENIGILVKNELIRETTWALDIVRLVGNSAVHAGKINLNESAKPALQMFDLVNFIVDQLINRKDVIKSMVSKIPQEKKNGVRQRDKTFFLEDENVK